METGKRFTAPGPWNLFGVLVGVLLSAQLWAASLSTSFVDVFVKDVPLGEAKRVENAKGQSLVFWNTGDVPLVIHVQALKPDGQELRPPAEPIEDPAWIMIQPSRLTLGPHEEGHCDVALSVPLKRNLRNRIFQAMIWTRSEPVQAQGISFTGGLKSRLRFQTTR